ncbi:Ser/Thr protein kinase RdoA (MazF antagonist) [Paenibacillus cellulosilyticus]|uniref:Ser/Thr protein kinase RdoA (MazF antagonist) n=1 Tax=Paenibacillus cellulosilyticus TaxID=375489 RepID=A0A2V2YR83_9BACL|nr:phosphotransferase [Paenibacillus cellulosilyticus]PWV99740.1 Ser/Thr protein kinase RdoA (MazF antagonist) [Paenibacillus cellulosilyticus]QKS44832.1 phosphotransferase [Paenibacillus cellulosilyticus]
MDPKIKQLLLDEHVTAGAARFGVSFSELSFIGGFQNFIYTYIREGVKYILRFTPGTLRSPEGLAAEIDWVRYLADKGLSVANSISSAAGLDFERIEGESINFYVSSFQFAPGRKIGYPECLDNPTLYEQCGRITSRLHKLSMQYEPSVKRHTWESNEYLLRANDYLPQEHPALQALEAIRTELSSLSVTAQTFGLIHGDISVGNFMVDEAAGITLFDFDECQYSWYIEDIAIQLYYLLYVFGEDSKSKRKEQYEQFMVHFERGYTAAGLHMPDRWREQLELFLRLREIIVVIGMHRSWDLSQPDEWTRDFLRDSTMRIARGISVIDGF